ncbi:hypothetical protein C0J52_25278 [Blattella germanica]|nr:hypothetical protein C0J52_25278 [Blattella germanica]
MSGAKETGGGGEHLNNSNNPRIMGALQYPTAEERNVTVQPNQPRQPHNLQDLLRFSVEASTTGQNASNQNVPFVPGPLDEERKTFLENTLKSMTVDVIEMLLQAIETLKRAGNLELEDDPTECEEALEQIASYVDNMDTANDELYRMGFVEQLVGLISEGSLPALEHLLSALLALVTDHPPSLEEEHEYSTTLLRLIFSGENEEER